MCVICGCSFPRHARRGPLGEPGRRVLGHATVVTGSASASVLAAMLETEVVVALRLNRNTAVAW